MTDFAKLVPVNVAAQQLFSRTVKYIQKQSDSFHLKFTDEAMIDEGEAQLLMFTAIVVPNTPQARPRTLTYHAAITYYPFSKGRSQVD